MFRNKKIYLLFYLLLVFPSFASPGPKENFALVVIDMQSYFITRDKVQNRGKNKQKVQAVIKTQIAAIKMAQKTGIPIVFIEYDESGETSNLLKTAAGKYKNVKYIKKTTDGMFEKKNTHRTELVDYLVGQNVGSLIITGSNGGSCVQESIEGALSENYDVIAFTKAIADFNYEDFIYPYDNIFKEEISIKCDECKFEETNKLDRIRQALVSKKVVREKSLSDTSINDSPRNTELELFPLPYSTDGDDGKPAHSFDK